MLYFMENSFIQLFHMPTCHHLSHLLNNLTLFSGKIIFISKLFEIENFKEFCY